jgi:predicted ribosome quality control (RQC) complex YloA/Tae2 family protein
MKAETFIYSWSALWLWMQYLNQVLTGAHLARTYTFQKGRLDIEFHQNEKWHRLSWQKQGNRVLITYTTSFSTPKKRVKVFDSLTGQPSMVKQVRVNQEDRLLTIELDQGRSLVFGAFTAAMNVYFFQDQALKETFLKAPGVFETKSKWIGADHQLPKNFVGSELLDFDLHEALPGLKLDNSSGEIGLPLNSHQKGVNIAELTLQVLRSKNSNARKVLPLDRIAAKVHSRWRRKLSKIKTELNAANNWKELQTEMQSWQIAQGYNLSPTNSKIEISGDMTPDGKSLTLQLDTDKTISDMVASLAKKIRKQKEKLTQLPQLVAEIEHDISNLESLIEKSSEDELRAFLIDHGEGLQHDGSQKSQRVPYKKYSSPNGYDILVGKSSRDNDTLTFKVSGKNDWWFHARQVRGSHVILRCGKTDPEQADILKAAELAAVNSKAKHSGIVVVQYCQRKHLTKPKGGSPGSVLVHNEKTVTVELN